MLLPGSSQLLEVTFWHCFSLNLICDVFSYFLMERQIVVLEALRQLFYVYFV